MKIILAAVIGGIIGFAISYFTLSSGASCPITSTPLVAVLIFAILGIIITLLASRK